MRWGLSGEYNWHRRRHTSTWLPSRVFAYLLAGYVAQIRSVETAECSVSAGNGNEISWCGGTDRRRFRFDTSLELGWLSLYSRHAATCDGISDGTCVWLNRYITTTWRVTDERYFQSVSSSRQVVTKTHSTTGWRLRSVHTAATELNWTDIQCYPGRRGVAFWRLCVLLALFLSL